jgi:hypothetical protein
MTITLTIPTQFVQKHVEKILPDNGISIANFNILPEADMTVVIVIGLYSSMKQVFWKKLPLFVQNIFPSRTQLSTNLHRETTFTQSESLA